MATKEEHIKHWLKSAKDDWKTARYLLDGNRYSACLFFTHLAIEKLLKGLVVIQTDDAPPYTHDLVRLTKTANMEVTPEQLESLETITTFNISGRYDDAKKEFYRQCTRAYAFEQFANARKIFLWLKKYFPKS